MTTATLIAPATTPPRIHELTLSLVLGQCGASCRRLGFLECSFANGVFHTPHPVALKVPRNGLRAYPPPSASQTTSAKAGAMYTASPTRPSTSHTGTSQVLATLPMLI